MIDKIHYKVELSHELPTCFRVRCTFDVAKAQRVRFSLPNWIPGSYLIRDFAKSILNVEAFDSDDKPIAIHKEQKNIWCCEAQAGRVELIYHIEATDRSVREAFIDEHYAYFNGTSVFFHFFDKPNVKYTFSVLLPRDKAWSVTCQLPTDNHDCYVASHYDELVDNPVILGDWDELEFDVYGCKHTVYLFGERPQYDKIQLKNDVAKICQHHWDFFGMSEAPNYAFYLLLTSNGYGGLEHDNSSFLMCPRAYLPLLPAKSRSDNYLTLLELFSHEYFHRWIVKGIRPDSFAPYNYNEENYTEELWIYEGITSYYDMLTLMRCELCSPQEYLSRLAKMLTRYMRLSGKDKQSLKDSSFDAWIKLYKATPNAINTQMSYYLKGAIVALLIDFHLRISTDNSVSLDQVVVSAWNRYKDTGVMPVGALRQRLIKVSSGKFDMAKFLAQAIDTCLPLPLKDTFSQMGIDYQAKEDSSLANSEELFGVILSDEDYAPEVKQIHDWSGFYDSGLRLGDRLVAINGYHVNKKSIHTVINYCQSDDNVSYHFIRDGILKQGELEANLPRAQSIELVQNMDKSHPLSLEPWING